MPCFISRIGVPTRDRLAVFVFSFLVYRSPLHLYGVLQPPLLWLVFPVRVFYRIGPLQGRQYLSPPGTAYIRFWSFKVKREASTQTIPCLPYFHLCGNEVMSRIGGLSIECDGKTSMYSRRIWSRAVYAAKLSSLSSVIPFAPCNSSLTKFRRCG